MLLYIARGNEVADGIMIANQLILKYGDYPSLLTGAMESQGSPKVENNAECQSVRAIRCENVT